MFLNSAHQIRWSESVQSDTTPLGMYAPLLILTAFPDLYKRLKPWIFPSYLDVEAMLIHNPVSTGEACLIRLAGNLYNGTQESSPYEIFSRCDLTCQRLAVDAIEMAFTVRSRNREEVRATFIKDPK